MRAYSEDLRRRVLNALDRGMSRSEVVDTFCVSLATLKRYLKQRRDRGTLTPTRPPGRPPTKRGALDATLPTLLSAQPDATLEQFCEQWASQTGSRLSSATMSRAIARLGWTRKKRRWLPPSETSSSAKPSAHASAREQLMPSSSLMKPGPTSI